MVAKARVSAAFAALKKLEQATVPGWEQSFISDQLLIDVATLVLDNADNAKAAKRDPAKSAFAALEVYRATKVPFYEQGSITDDVLRSIVSTVLATDKG